MKVWALPFCLGILAIFAANLSFVISVNGGFVETCFPYLEGCASISKSARNGLSAILFKLIVLPVMTLLSIYWFISYCYIKNLKGIKVLQNNLMLITGIIGSLFGILYTAFLGSEGDIYQLLRRFGIYFFFLGTYVSQALEVTQLTNIFEIKDFKPLRGMKFLIFFIGFIILVSTPFYGFIEKDDWLENVLEWNITFLICSYFIVSSFLWRKIKLQVNLEFNQFRKDTSQL